MGLAPLNAIWAEYALENLGYSQSEAAQLIAPLTNKNAIIQMNQFFQNNPIKDTTAYAALRNEGIGAVLKLVSGAILNCGLLIMSDMD